jgi:hypothetical protein
VVSLCCFCASSTGDSGPHLLAEWEAGRQTDTHSFEPTAAAHAWPPLSPNPPSIIPLLLLPESRLSLPLSSALTGGVLFLCFYLCFCHPHPRPRPSPSPSPHTYRPTLTPIQLVRRKPSFTDRTSEITLRYHRRGLVDRFFLDGPTVDFSNRIPTSICLINCHNSQLVSGSRPLPACIHNVPRSWRQDRR